MAWTIADMPDLAGRVAIVTGANSGIGLETARVLAGSGAKVVLACRSRAKAEVAIAEILATQPRADLRLAELDLASLESVRAFAESARAEYEKLDLLINNAGVMALPEGRTRDGLEMQMGTNHFGHFALTGLLLPSLLATPGSRVVTVSSLAHKMGGVGQRDRYFRWQAYGDSKLANLLFTFEFQRRATDAQAATIAVAAHPGYSSTNLTGSMRMPRAMVGLGNRIVAQSAARGAEPTLYAAVEPSLRGGEFVGPRGPMQLIGHPKLVRPSARARDPRLAAELWARSEATTGVRYAWG